MVISWSSPRAWFVKFNSLHTTFGFVSYTTDPTVLTKKIEDGLNILVIYVDNIFVTRSDEASISTTKAYSTQHYFFETKFTYQDKKFALTQ
ncbi:unnamed protein product [Spirodela intermedia]|uniref:Reverse transcriptase Ty1/copia-type domain-containing protein n=1 Tax=Spirodela intermedia TaxID=51605 RepID=A0ABN7EBG5_SPIIN|nr:unnamed protein product [Spirodela intermedia]